MQVFGQESERCVQAERMQTGRKNWAKLADVEYCELGGFDCNFGVIAASRAAKFPA
jgi:hypothetical protein